MTDFTHIRENNEDTEQHLSENREKFETDAQFLLKQMKRGERLTAQTVVQKYSCEPRRLRDLHNEGKCSKEWKTNEAGKRLYVEYFCEISKPPSKASVIDMWKGKLNQQKLF